MDQSKAGRFIAACRKEKGMTQNELAQRLGVTDRAVSKWENGRGLPDASGMLALCDALGVTVNELLTGERLAVENYQKKAEENLMEMKRADENMAHRLRVLGKSMMAGYGVRGACALAMLIYHLYLNYTDAAYTGQYFNGMLPLLVVMTLPALGSSAVVRFVNTYDFVKK